MIEYLKINDLALLREAQLEFSKGFTVVTGETGAGKSVLLGALSMLAGNRCGREIIRNGADFCKVEAMLSFDDTSKIDAYLSANGIPTCEDGALVLARQINREKTGRAFVNGTLVSLSTLAGLGEHWVDFHGPGEPQKLFSRVNQLGMLDTFAASQKLRNAYLALFEQRQNALAEIEKVSSAKSLSGDEIEFLKMQIEAIDKVNPTEESIAELEEKSKLAEMASDIVEKSSAIAEFINGENGASEALASASRLSAELADAGERAEVLRNRIVSASVEIADIADEYEALARSSNMSEDEISDVRERMSAWLTLARKYGVSPQAVKTARDNMAAKIEMQSDVKASVRKLEELVAKLASDMQPIGREIMRIRQKAAKSLSQNVANLLERLGFKNARFEISITDVKEPSRDCGSECEFNFSANPGQPAMPLAKIASSGELARVMLAINTTLAEADSTPLLVFDEVDANVGGEIGAEVGKELANLANRHQVFCVTHLPQVAACAHNHFLVEKNQTKTSTSVSISQIGDSRQRRVSELARMLGDRASDSAIAHAQKLLDKSF